MNNMNLDEIIKNIIKNKIGDKLDKMIEQETSDFYNKLVREKDNYMSEIMQSIRIIHEQSHLDNKVDYRITFENVYKIGG